jgi:hypothetical protein
MNESMYFNRRLYTINVPISKLVHLNSIHSIITSSRDMFQYTCTILRESCSHFTYKTKQPMRFITIARYRLRVFITCNCNKPHWLSGF